VHGFNTGNTSEGLDETGGACGWCGEEESCVQGFDGNTRNWRKWQNNVTLKSFLVTIVAVEKQ
jgi:hypothetical protein